MSERKNRLKYREILNHRTAVYEKALDKLIAGRETVEYVHYRFQKLKALK